jgi:hypothetical protein
MTRTSWTTTDTVGVGPGPRKEVGNMRFLLAWLLGVPGIVILIWFLLAR